MNQKLRIGTFYVSIPYNALVYPFNNMSIKKHIYAYK